MSREERRERERSDDPNELIDRIQSDLEQLRSTAEKELEEGKERANELMENMERRLEDLRERKSEK